MFFSFLQWLFIVLLILYLSLCLFGDKAKTVAVILIAAAVICQVSFHTFSYFRWLGYPSPAEFVMNLSDSYPGHSVECLRSSKIYYDGMDKIFPDCYKDFLNIYGEPLGMVLLKRRQFFSAKGGDNRKRHMPAGQ